MKRFEDSTGLLAEHQKVCEGGYLPDQGGPELPYPPKNSTLVLLSPAKRKARMGVGGKSK
jgi:hypothetical protein